jgi:hypothetical protein
MLDCSCLASTQEEADTCIIWHALYSDKLYQENNVQGRIVVKSPDTDVLFEHRVLPDTKERKSGITPS